MTEDKNRPPPICGVFTPNNEAANYFYNTANYYYQVGHHQTNNNNNPHHLYERTQEQQGGDVVDLSQISEVVQHRGSSSSAFTPVNPGDSKPGNKSGGCPIEEFYAPPRTATTLMDSALHQHHTTNSNMKSKKYNSRYPLPEKPRQKRAVIQDMVRPLKQWLVRHRHNPYPTKTEKVQLALGSNMTLVQVSNWFANARRRLKNVVQDSRCSWSKRLRMYNQFVQGNAELLSIASDDSIWNSEDEDEMCDKPHRKSHPPLVHEEEDSCGRTPASSADGIDDGLRSPSLAKDGSPKYKTSILHRYLADSVESASVASHQQIMSHHTQKHSHLPIRPVPNRSKEDRLYKPYKVVRSKIILESSQKVVEEDEDDPLVVVDDEEHNQLHKAGKGIEGECEEDKPVFPSLPSHLHPSFPLWHHPAFHLPPPLFSPFLASSPHKDLLKLLYNDALLARSKDLELGPPPPPSPSPSYEGFIDRLGQNLPLEPLGGGAGDFPHTQQQQQRLQLPIKSSSSLDILNNHHPQTQVPSSTPALFI
ncbi:uncharacterized protein [Lepeophtheirus salmonis]|uniref:uncharacterized protein n=1 Tax=Lepeophtheirus salmonis TaxID=72036 RepID=UPI001AE27528|nr:iroquois-class homeodomain protein IRX-2-like [Lepeophtheirus salmonis]